MSHVAGYFVLLTEDRYYSFVSRSSEKFGQPVPEFPHSRNIPLVCFILDKKGTITHVGLGKRGVVAGTDLRRLNVDDIVHLENPVSAREIANATPGTVRHHLINKIERGGLIPEKSFEEFLSVLLERASELTPMLEKFARDRRLRIEQLPERAKKSLLQSILQELINPKYKVGTILRQKDQVLFWME